MKPIILAMLIAVCLSACSSAGSHAVATTGAANQLTEDEKHRLYTAALAASESPMETELFKDVCKKIGIFDTQGNPNDKYMAFVASHVDWGMSAQSEQFRREINSREKAQNYVRAHLPQ